MFRFCCGIEGWIIMENCSRTVLTAVFVSIEVALLTEMKLYSSRRRRSVELAVKTLTRRLKGTFMSLNFKNAVVWLVGVGFLDFPFGRMQTPTWNALRVPTKQTSTEKILNYRFNNKKWWIARKSFEIFSICHFRLSKPCWTSIS